MKGFRTKVFAVLALTVAVSACSDEFGPQPDQLLSPESASLAKNPAAASNGNGNGPGVPGKKKGHAETQYFQLAVQRPTASRGSGSAWIGATGGTLRFAGHVLTIPAGAVSQSTFFEVKEAQAAVDWNLAAITFDLTAVRMEGGKYVDVGARGFDVPVVFCVNYASAIGHENQNVQGGTLLWLQSLTRANEAAESWANPSDKQVCGQLEHFSRWALAWPM